MEDISETSSRRYPLANDSNGNPINLPTEAAAWRVRKLARKAGRPRMIYDGETGRPLELPLAISFTDFAESVNEAGRYRLEAVDGQGRLLSGCIAVVELVFDDEADDAEDTKVAKPSAFPAEAMQLIAQLVDTNSRVMQAMASAFGQVHPTPSQPIVLPAPATPAAERSSSFMENPMVKAMAEQFLMAFLKPSVAAPVTTNAGTAEPTPLS